MKKLNLEQKEQTIGGVNCYLVGLLGPAAFIANIGNINNMNYIVRKVSACWNS